MKIFALIGFPLGHTLSPYIHSRLFMISGYNALYEAIEVEPEKLKSEIPSLISSLEGFNVTIPHKCSIIPYLDELDDTAAIYGSVNTVSCKGSKSKGYNTDCYGFLKALECENLSLEGNIAILGSGGVARIFAFESAFAGCNVTLCVRESDKGAAHLLKNEIERHAPGALVYVNDLHDIPKDTDLLINSTPVGMYPNTDACPVPAGAIKNAKAVFDAVYNPAQTKLLEIAKSLSAKTVKGIGMLVWQAVKAHEIWYNATFEQADILSLISECEKQLSHFGG